ncbi:hypothetical protein [Oceanidesulfovibrio marinus]|uniref:Antitoxin SocA-like Panacea domain-containing protein n=1 Tax=Oceanidesulfovibrio marinus TaxID=370038 RepID=A0A6P1ZJR3_9BACT|nr:hypothetical protein [Oceanidesulfovibrio marinus]TVM35796.1 hypothetical protein DQK91_03805 [Oceanidesulfovibrio marinus]
MHNNPKETVATVLKALYEKQISLDKIILHKFIYFLDTQGVATGLHFEPYTYGPFSFELASTLGSLAFWDIIKEEGSTIQILDHEALSKLTSPDIHKISNYFDLFQSTLGQLDFRTLEIAGTVLYCAESLSLQGLDVSDSSVVKEFRQWKGNRYESDEIIAMFQKLKPVIFSN